MAGIISRLAQPADFEVLADSFKLAPDVIFRALPSSIYCTYPPDAAVVREGDRGSEVYAVIEGSFSVRHSQWLLFSKEVARLKPGELFGEIGFLSPAARLASVVAVGYSAAVRIAPAEFKGLLEKNSEFRARIEALALQRVYGIAKDAKSS
ncbi:MAG: cyclic nucleotide-binding domain-containing protein [Elusimicrobiota bacterium]